MPRYFEFKAVPLGMGLPSTSIRPFLTFLLGTPKGDDVIRISKDVRYDIEVAYGPV
ncbi:hypothetical protein ADUPG1_004570, partial [Aduncisulcus paluster]